MRMGVECVPPSVERECVRIGYRMGAELGRDFYSTALHCYWIDSNLDEQPLVVKVIHLTRDHSVPQTSGTTGVKHIRVRLGDRKTIAIKATLLAQLMPEFALLKEESRQLNRLSHENLVIIKDMMCFKAKESKTSADVIILMFIEYCDHNLKLKLQTFHNNTTNYMLSEREIVNWSAQIARGLAYLHSRGISHSNLKPSNILVFHDKDIKGGVLLRLSDFGLSMLFPLKFKPQRDENDLYRDPLINHIFANLDQLSSDELTYDAIKADIWSLAVIITEFVLNFKQLFKLFAENTEKLEKLGEIYVNKIKDTAFSTDLSHLLSNTLIYKQDLRLDIIGVCNHAFIAKELREQRDVIRKITDGLMGDRNAKAQKDQTDHTSDHTDEHQTGDMEYTVNDKFGLEDKMCEKFIEDKE